jgi:hypothetical protein
MPWTMTVPSLVMCVWQALVLAGYGLGLGVLIVRRGGLPSRLLTPIAVAAAAVQAYFLFFVFLWHPAAGTRAAQVLLLLDLALLWRERRHIAALSRDAWAPAALVVATSLGYLLVVDVLPVVPNQRYFAALPPDNVLPRYLADNIHDGVYLRPGEKPPIIDDYRASDRPPLQAALVLMTRAVSRGKEHARYHVLGTLCQGIWAASAWELFGLLGLGRRRVFATGLLIASGFFLLNTTYVWPKLLTAWLFLTAVALLADPDSPRGRPLGVGMAVGALFALALLGHGGVAFSMVTLPLLLWLLRPRWFLAWRTLVVAGAVLGALLAPWSAYQRWADPPGNRLVKMHLAGVNGIDERSTVKALIDAYSTTPVRELIANRVANLEEQWLVFGKAPVLDPFRWIQWQQFFHHVPALGVLIAGLIYGASRAGQRTQPPGERRLFLILLAYATVTLVVWIVLMFQPNQAVVHQGSYANTMLLFVLGAAGVGALPQPWRSSLAAVHVAIFVAWVVPWPVAVRPAGGLPTSFSHLAAGLGTIAAGLWIAGRTAPAPPLE